MYEITKASQASGRARNWKQDPNLPVTDTLAPSAYDGTNTKQVVDRGHQAPLADLGGPSDWQSLNYLSNISYSSCSANGPNSEWILESYFHWYLSG